MKLEEVKLKDISINNRGYYGIGASAVAHDENKYTYLRITDINDDGTLNTANLMSVDDKNAKDFLLQKNDIVFARTGASTGRNYFYDGEIDNMVFAGFLIKFSIDEKKVNPKFVKYYCLSQKYRNWIASSLTGSTRPNINEKQLAEMPITIPNRDYQDKIVKILDSITKKIRLNNQINDNLFELLKIEFKTKFYNKNSDAKLSDYISNTIGGDWGKELPVDNYNTKVYCVRGADIPNMEYGNKGNAPTRYILEKNYNNKKLKPNNIIIEISGGSPTQSTGRTAYITENILSMYDAPLLCTNFCRAIETKKDIYAPFVYMYLTLMYEEDIFFNWENGTTGIKNLALNDLLLNIEITQPNEDELNNYYILFNNIMNKISNNSNENIKLEQLRDTLLPKLMNGEIDLEKINLEEI